MAKLANRKMIGGFVVIAVGILAASVVIFGSGDWFKESLEYVLYFEESVKGLNVGSPVLYRGVQVGAVKKIIIRTHLKNLKDFIPVFVEIYPERIEIVAENLEYEHWKTRLPEAINLGLRARLVTQSLITGQLAIELDHYPETPVVLQSLDKDYEEIPTIPSTLSKLEASLANLDLREVSERLLSVLTNADRILKNRHIDDAISEFKGALIDARVLVQNVNSKVDPLADNLNGALVDARKLVNKVDEKVDPVSQALSEALESADAAFKSIDDLVGQRSATRAELDNALIEITGAARSFRVLADYLQQHPDALIKGKGYKNY